MADAGKRTKESTGESIKQEITKIGGAFTIQKSPAFLSERLKKWEGFYAKYAQQLAANEKKDINITLKDGKVLPGKAWETTPLDIAKKISKKLAENVVVARIIYEEKIGQLVAVDVEEEEEHQTEKKEGVLWDLTRPLEGNCKLELLNFDDPSGVQTFWHSSAHILGQALENSFGGHLCIGPPLQRGFYYDVYVGDNTITPAQFAEIEKAYAEVCKANQPFQRLVLTKEEAIELFSANPFKVQLIKNKVPEGGITSAYRCGTLIDLCTGPHLPGTGNVKAFKALKASSAYWLGKSGNDDLQRVYGITFPSEKQLNEWVKLQEEIEKRDHKNLGVQQQLFQFHTLSPGSCFFLPHGAYIYNRLIEFMRKQYKIRGFQEVITPNIFNCQLFAISGHLEKYKENMFILNIEKQDFGMKPMNCPGHCLVFDMFQRSYRELPVRMADFGVLHRNELSGALTGLTRVRRFQQDDAHIFVTPDQIMTEIMGQLDFLKYIYEVFGFDFALELSTRPDNALGDKELWDKAEAALTEALTKFGKPWKLNPGDGAFYGPKIDIKLFDALKREHQCGTIQLDFNLPIRFNLQYRSAEDESLGKPEEETKEKAPEVETLPVAPKKDATSQLSPAELSSEKKYHVGHHHLPTGFARPVIIHRAILGSCERFLAICTEHFGGKWPFWLSPRQAVVVPVSEKHIDFATAVCTRLKLEGYQVELDRTNVTLNKKVRNAQIHQYNYILVVGEEEKKAQCVDVRSRDSSDRIGKMTIPEVLKLFKSLDPVMSSVEKAAWESAFKSGDAATKTESQGVLSEADCQALNNELLLKTFLSGDGNEAGPKDDEVYEKTKTVTIDAKATPNLFRWHSLMRKLKGA